jgi:hypothetical protein
MVGVDRLRNQKIGFSFQIDEMKECDDTTVFRRFA